MNNGKVEFDSIWEREEEERKSEERERNYTVSVWVVTAVDMNWGGKVDLRFTGFCYSHIENVINNSSIWDWKECSAVRWLLSLSEDPCCTQTPQQLAKYYNPVLGDSTCSSGLSTHQSCMWCTRICGGKNGYI